MFVIQVWSLSFRHCYLFKVINSRLVGIDFYGFAIFHPWSDVLIFSIPYH